MTFVSVVIPMFNEQQHIGRTLAAIKAAAEHAHLDYELLVVDNGSTDNGPQIASQAGARLLPGAHLTIAALRNLGAGHARGDLLAFVDADVEVPQSWLTLWQQVRQADQADVLALVCDTPARAPWFARAWQRRTLSAGRAEQRRTWLPTANLCLSRDWFERVGGFDERLRTGEDKDFGLRLSAAGARLVSLSSPPAWHWGYEHSWTEWWGKEYWRQGSHLQLFRESNGFRHLRFPLLCWAVLLLNLAGLAALVSGHPGSAVTLLLPGILAASGLSLRQGWRHHDGLFILQLSLLHWIRLHLGAIALLAALADCSVRRPARG